VILSAADIRDLIGGDPVLKLLVRIKIVDGKPPAEAGTGVAIYIDRYPTVSEFEASWRIWLVDFDGEPLDIIIEQLRKVLPKLKVVSLGIITELQTTELKNDSTQVKPVAAVNTPRFIVDAFEKRFQDLVESIQDRMLLVGPGRPGKDGRDGSDGQDGRDGQDINATDTELGELKDVDTTDAKEGQFLMFDGVSWVTRFIPQIFNYASGSGGSGGGGGGIQEPPNDGNYYVRVKGNWVELREAINNLNLDGGDFNP